MKDYVERYIYAVTRRLPLESRADVEKELKAHIYDMLSEKPDEQEIDRVLHELGHPREIASNYDDRTRFVVAPAYYADYQMVLKIGLTAIGIFTLFFSALDALLTVNQDNVWRAIGYVFEHVINGTINGLLWGFAIITVGFWIASSEKIKKKNKTLKMKNLMEGPKNLYRQKYKHSKAVASLVFQVIASTVFIVILLYYLERFGIYVSNTLVAPMFGMDIITPYIPVLISAQVFMISAQALLVGQRRYSFPMLLTYTVGKVLSAILTLVIIQTQGFITDQFITATANNIGMASSDLSHAFHVTIVVFTVLIIVGTISDLFTQWRKLFVPFDKKIK